MSLLAHVVGGEAAMRDERRLRSLVDFVPALSPHYMPPTHLEQLLRRFELAVDGVPQRVCCSAPPRHAKTESVLHVPAFALRRKPELRFSYSTYADRLSRSKSRKARHLAELAGVELESSSLNEWRTREGGGLLAGGVGGPLTGHGVDIGIVDDPCVAEGQLVTTRRGLVPIERVMVGDEVFTHMARWRRVAATYDNGIKDTMRVTTNAGSVIVTPEHLLYTPNGWIQAQFVSEVFCAAYMSEVQHEVSGPQAEGLLLSRVPDGLAAPACQGVRMVPRAIQKEGVDGEVLLAEMRDCCGVHSETEDVQGVCCSVLDEQASADILFGQVPTESVAECVQKEERRSRGEGLAFESVQGEALAGTESLNRAMRGVLVDGRPDLSPHGLQHQERQPKQSDCALQLVPHAVSQVERLGPARVFDLTVEEDHSFIAGGVVVHNCKNRLDAESAIMRERLVDWMHDVLLTRIEPGGSVFVFATRWHTDDLIGRMVDEGFEHINLPALDVDERPLWPERWSADAMRARRDEVGEYTWASLYQGQPRPRGGRVFNDVVTYETVPHTFRTAIGLDLATSTRTSADYSVAVLMARVGEDYFVLDIIRAQLAPPDFRRRVRLMANSHPTASVRWYAAGMELGAASFFAEGDDGVQLQAMPARGDKFTRAIGYAAAWNAGRVKLPRRAPWVSDFVTEHAAFTGVNDAHDDTIDAAVAAFDLLHAGGAVTGPMSAPARETARLRLTRL